MPLLVNEAGDDRDDIQPGDRVVLIVENDLPFAKVLLETARENGFKGLVTSQGAAALALAREFTADLITLDMNLPDIDGWRVLDRLKSDLVDAAHSRVRHLDRRVARARVRRRRAGLHRRSRSSRRTCSTPACAACSRPCSAGRSASSSVRATPPRRTEVFGLIACDWVELTTAADPAAFMTELQEQEFDCAVIETQLGVSLADVDRACERNPVHGRLPVILLGPPDRQRAGSLREFRLDHAEAGALAGSGSSTGRRCSCTTG